MEPSRDAKGATKATPQINLQIDHEDPIATATQLYAKVESQELCCHAKEGSLHRKKNMSLNIADPESKDGSNSHKGCIICYADGFRSGFSAAWRVKLDGFDFGSVVAEILKTVQRPTDTTSFKTGLAFGYIDGSKDSEENYNSLRRERYLTLTAQYFDDKTASAEGSGATAGCSFMVDPNQYGEMFHILFAKLFDPLITVTHKEGGNIWEVFDYYMIKDSEGNVDKPKDETTKILCQAFKGKASNQEIIFKDLRSTLERLYCPDSSPRTDTARKSPEYYCGISYLGKYWINRFLTQTEQGVPKEDKIRRQLPKKKDVSLIALIYIRLQGLDGSKGRSMTDENIKVCLRAIARANSAALEDKKFSHILFFGDFETEEKGRNFKELVKNTKGLNNVQVLYIAKPWMSTVKMETRIQKFWAEYQAQDSAMSIESESGSGKKRKIILAAPLQVRNMAMFLALQARYEERLCAIGLRCGYLDLAGFIGIPTFFVDTAWPGPGTGLR